MDILITFFQPNHVETGVRGGGGALTPASRKPASNLVLFMCNGEPICATLVLIQTISVVECLSLMGLPSGKECKEDVCLNCRRWAT